RAARLALAGRLMSGGCELRIAAPAAASAHHDKALVSAAEVVQLFAAFIVVKDGPDRHFQNDAGAVSPGLIRALTVPPTLSFIFGIEAEVNQRVVALAGFHHDIAATASIATRWTATRHILLSAEGDAAVAPVAGFYSDFCFIYEHGEAATSACSQEQHRHADVV